MKKRLLAIFLVLLSTILLVACNGNGDVDPDIAIVASAKESLEVGFASGDTKDTITKNVTLATTAGDDVTVSWSSDNLEVLNHAGRVSRPRGNNVEVTLTATLTKGEASDTKTFKVTVIKVDGTPKIKGVSIVVEVNQGEFYDPLYGVTAESLGEDVTDSLETTFNPEWLNTPGFYDFEITAKSSFGEVAVEIVFLEVLESNAVPVFIVAPTAVTHYIGSRTFNPLEEVRAFYIDENGSEQPVDVYVHTEPARLNIPGTFPYKVAAYNNLGEEVVHDIKLTVKARHQVLADLPKGEAIDIELWHANGTTIENALKEYAELFEIAMAAAGYKINVTIMKNGSNYDELKTNVINAGKGGSLPNIVQNYPDHVVEYNANGYIEPMAPYIFHPVHGFDESDPEDKFTDILEGYRNEQRATNLNGEYISLPFNKSTEVLSYNKDIFDEVLEGRPFPRTWQELFALMPRINEVKDKHIDAIAARWAVLGKPLSPEEIQKSKDDFVPFVYDSSANAFITLTRQFGGGYTSIDAKGKGQLDFDSAETREMLSYFGQASIDKIFTVPARWEAQYTNEVSKTGKAIAGVGSTGGLRYNTPVESGYKLYNLGVAPVPYDQFSPESRTVIQQGTNLSLTTSGTQAQKLASWYFIKFLTSGGIQTLFSVETGYSPVRDSVYTSDAYMEYLALADTVMADSHTQMMNDEGKPMSAAEYTTLYELVVKAMGSRAATQQRAYQFTDTPFIGSSATRDAVGVTFDRVILKEANQTLDAAIEAAISYGIAEALKGIPNN